MKHILLILSGILGIVSGLAAAVFGPPEIVSIRKDPELFPRLVDMKLDLLMEKEGRVYIVAGSEDLVRLAEAGISYTIETAHFPAAFPTLQELSGGINGPFHSYVELERDLLALADAHPEIAQVIDIGDSLEGRNLYALKISDNVWADEGEPGVLILGCHHAREWISVEVPYLLGKYLAENYASSAEIQRLVDSSEVWIVPLVNPDGLEYSIHFYRYWRKNRRDNGDGTFGVDLNRNYGYQWGWDNRGSSPEPSSEVYRGKAPFSEPETQALRDVFLGRRFQALVSYHSYSQVILYPWGYTIAPSEKDALLLEIADEMAARMASVNGRYYEPGRAGASFYLTNGDTTDWSFGTYGIPSYTIELPPDSRLRGEFFNSDRDIQPLFEENLPAMLYLIDWAVAHYEGQKKAPAREKTLPESELRLK
ncbi:MAG: M14 family metallopeptidase [Candidatus Aminicenantales bacterium]